MQKILIVSVLLGVLAQRGFSGENETHDFAELARMAAAQRGCKVVCPPELMNIINKRGMRLGRDWGGMNTAEQWNELFADEYKLRCVENSRDKTFVFDVAWRTDDKTSPATLLARLLNPPEKVVVYDGIYEFNALLSKDVNFAKAWKVRQMSFYQSVFFARKTLAPQLVQKIISREGRQYILAITIQPIQISPGEGSMAWYLFDRNGKLVSADLVSTGWRLWYETVSVHGSNELQMILNFNHDQRKLNVVYVVEGDQLKPVRVVDSDGQSQKLDDSRIGKSFMTEL